MMRLIFSSRIGNTILTTLLFAIVFPAALLSQPASKTHIFPQFVEGRMSDGTSYHSLMTITNLSSSASSCVLSIGGISDERYAVQFDQSLQSGESTVLNLSIGQRPVITGFGVLECSQPVQASLMYTFAASNGATLGMSTVFSAPLAGYASIPLLSTGNFRYGIALVNTNAWPISIKFVLSSPGNQITDKTVEIPPGGQYLHFVDEVLSVPSTQGLHIFQMASSSKFNVTALLFDGAIFTTIVPATLP